MNQEQFAASSNLHRIKELSHQVDIDAQIITDKKQSGEHIPVSKSARIKVLVVLVGCAVITINDVEYITLPGNLRYVKPDTPFSVVFTSDTELMQITIPIKRIA